MIIPIEYDLPQAYQKLKYYGFKCILGADGETFTVPGMAIFFPECVRLTGGTQAMAMMRTLDNDKLTGWLQ
mgnify:CR=1 FL=1